MPRPPRARPRRPRPRRPATRDPRAYFTDLELRTHDDQPVRFYTDTMEGRTVVINFIYTNCKDACPLITQKMLQVRDLLGDRSTRRSSSSRSPPIRRATRRPN